jgi:anti-sigma factor RsiW
MSRGLTATPFTDAELRAYLTGSADQQLRVAIETALENDDVLARRLMEHDDIGPLVRPGFAALEAAAPVERLAAQYALAVDAFSKAEAVSKAEAGAGPGAGPPPIVALPGWVAAGLIQVAFVAAIIVALAIGAGLGVYLSHFDAFRAPLTTPDPTPAPPVPAKEESEPRTPHTDTKPTTEPDEVAPRPADPPAGTAPTSERLIALPAVPPPPETSVVIAPPPPETSVAIAPPPPETRVVIAPPPPETSVVTAPPPPETSVVIAPPPPETSVAIAPPPKPPAWLEVVANYVRLMGPQTFATTRQTRKQLNAALAAATDRVGTDLSSVVRKVPELRLQRVDLLALNGAPLVQLAFLDTQGRHVAICVIRRPAAAAVPAKRGEAAQAKSTSLYGLNLLHWDRDRNGFLVIGGVGPEELARIAGRLGARS